MQKKPRNPLLLIEFVSKGKNGFEVTVRANPSKISTPTRIKIVRELQKLADELYIREYRND